MNQAKGLFLATSELGLVPGSDGIVRYRFVEIDFQQLLDADGRPRDKDRIILNLFPDVTLTGVVERVTSEEGGYTWIGRIESPGLGNLSMVYVSGAFVGHFAGPLGVYEVSSAGKGNLYRIVQIDQQRFGPD